MENENEQMMIWIFFVTVLTAVKVRFVNQNEPHLFTPTKMNFNKTDYFLEQILAEEFEQSSNNSHI